jgi:hypothetical protein
MNTQPVRQLLCMLGLVAAASAPAWAQDKPAVPAKPAAAAKATAHKDRSDKATVPAKATVDTATRPATGRDGEALRYKSRDGAPCHDKSADA